MAAGLVYVGVSTTLSALAALVEGSVTPAIATGALLVALAPAVLAFRASAVETSPPPSRWDLAAIAAFALVSVRHFGWIAFERDGRILTGDAYNFGDLPLHWTYVRFFARGAAFWPENPIFTGARLQYPFGMDLFNGLFVALGVPVSVTLSVAGLLAAAALGVSSLPVGRGVRDRRVPLLRRDWRRRCLEEPVPRALRPAEGLPVRAAGGAPACCGAGARGS